MSSIKRSVHVLELLARKGPLGVGAIAQQLKLPLGSVHRLLLDFEGQRPQVLAALLLKRRPRQNVDRARAPRFPGQGIAVDREVILRVARAAIRPADTEAAIPHPRHPPAAVVATPRPARLPRPRPPVGPRRLLLPRPGHRDRPPDLGGGARPARP